MRAAARMSSAGTPQISATRSGGYCITFCFSFSNPTVWSRTKLESIQPFAISSCWSPFRSAMFVPFRIGRSGVGLPREVGRARVDHDEPRPVRTVQPVEDPHPQDGVRLRDVV